MAKSITGFYLALAAAITALIPSLLAYFGPSNLIAVRITLPLSFLEPQILICFIVSSLILVVATVFMLKNAKIASILSLIVGIIFGLFSNFLVAVLAIFAASVAASEAAG